MKSLTRTAVFCLVVFCVSSTGLNTAEANGSHRQVDRQPRKPVLIYYANETSMNQRGTTIVKLLKQEKGVVAKFLAKQLEEDYTKFSAQVEADRAAIRGGISSSRTPIAAILFTNQLALTGNYAVVASGKEGVKTERWKLPTTKSTTVNAYPLCSRETFTAAIEQTCRRFPPAQHVYLLIVKTHAPRRLALTQWAAETGIDTRSGVTKTIDEIEDRIRKKLGFDPFAGLDLFASLDLLKGLDIQEAIDSIDGIQLGDDHLGDDHPERSQPGMLNRNSHLDVLEKLERSDELQFALVIAEICRGKQDRVSITRPDDRPANVDEAILSEMTGMRYGRLDLNRVFARAKDKGDLAAALRSTLSKKPATSN